MARSSSTSSSSDYLTEQELQLLKRLSRKYEQKESGQKKFVEESSSKKDKSKSETKKSKGEEKSKEKVSGSRIKGMDGVSVFKSILL
ncbi:hypothetical protein JCGZ_00060 [Jatropha curcas]|uniref:Uncharacterized protein n=1 Tax=Jatropha curcas TaxID=180498 RepID=A0A067L4J6_JATCU|nr:hypothetical protein JCGZ_00060 [Jatropha curcas]